MTRRSSTICVTNSFRLDLSRLHADWLLKSKDFAKALEFDQLRKVMAGGDNVFEGFEEAGIDFAPTFKYDLLPRARSGPTAPLPRDESFPSDDHLQSSISSASSTSNSELITTSSAPSDDETAPCTIPSVTNLTKPSQSILSTAPQNVNTAKVRFLTLLRVNSSRTTPPLPSPELDDATPMPTKEQFFSRPPLHSTAKSDSSLVVLTKQQLAENSVDTAVFDSSVKQRVQSYTGKWASSLFVHVSFLTPDKKTTRSDPV
jgi:hypothetical protein